MEIDSVPQRLRTLPSWLLNRASLPAQQLVRDGLATVGAHRYHYAVLASLDEFGPASQAELTRRSSIDRSDMVALIGQLVAEGFVERTPDPEDRRRNVITLTSSGRRRLDQLHEAVTEAQVQLVAPLSGGDRQELARLLDLIVRHHAALSGHESPDRP